MENDVRCICGSCLANIWIHHGVGNENNDWNSKNVLRLLIKQPICLSVSLNNSELSNMHCNLNIVFMSKSNCRKFYLRNTVNEH